jgi:hypothetical protein
MMNDQTDLQIQDLLANPKAYGLPTLEEFAAAPEKWRKAADDIFKTADIGSTMGLKNIVAKQTYEVSGYKCDTLEEVERVALNEGLDIKLLELKPQIIPLGGGKCNIHVVFAPKVMTTENMIEQAVSQIITT